LSLTSNIDEVLAAWKEKPRKLERALEKGFERGLREFESKRVIQAQLTGRRGNDYGLNSQTGHARISTNTKVYREGLDKVGVITFGSSAWYLKVHQHYNFSGYIRPKNGMYLTIPVNPAARGKRARDMDLVFIKLAGKYPILVKRDALGMEGKSKKIPKSAIMFILKEQVYIPKRLYLYEEFATYGESMIKNRILQELRLAVDERVGWET